MERDNEAIELQFVAGQRAPPVGHYCEARRPFKEFKVHLREWLQPCTLSLQECVSLPASHQYTAGRVGVGILGLLWGENKTFRMMSEVLWIMSVRHKLLRNILSAKENGKADRKYLLRAFGISMYIYRLYMYTTETDHSSNIWIALGSPRINFCHIIKTLTEVGSATIPPTKPTEPLTNPQRWILPSSPLSLHLDSIHSHFKDCKWSTHVTSRCAESLDYNYIIFLNQCYSGVM